MPCRLGFAGREGACVACPAGTYSNSAGAAACTPCPVGTFSTVVAANRSDTCVSCADAPQPGFSILSGQSSPAVCRKCMADTPSLRQRNDYQCCEWRQTGLRAADASQASFAMVASSHLAAQAMQITANLSMGWGARLDTLLIFDVAYAIRAFTRAGKTPLIRMLYSAMSAIIGRP